MRKLITLITILIISINLLAQDTIKKFGNFNLNDFKPTEFEKNANYDAIIQQHVVSMFFDEWLNELRLFYTVHTRIKILNKKGLKYATVEVPYISKYHFEDIGSMRGFTVKNKDNKIIRKRLKQRYINNIEINDTLNVRKMYFKDAKPGDIIEYKYTIATLSFAEPRPIYFRQDVPILAIEVNTHFPEFIQYRYQFDGDIQLDENYHENNYYSISWKGDNLIYYRNRKQMIRMQFPSNYHRFRKFYSMPAIKEPYPPSNNIRYGKLKLILSFLNQKTGYYSNLELYAWKKLTKRLYQTLDYQSKISNKDFITHNAYPAGYILCSTDDWDKTYKRITKYSSFWKKNFVAFNQLHLIDSLKNRTDDNQLNTAIAVYDYIRKNIKWDGKYNKLSNYDINETYKRKIGNSAEIHNLHIAILKRLGIDAFPVFISTRKHGLVDKDFASFRQFNNMLAGATINGKNYVFDACNPYRSYKLLGYNSLNGFGWALTKDKHFFIDLKDIEATNEKYVVDIKLNDLNEQKITINYQSTGYAGLSNTIAYADFGKTKIINNLFNDVNTAKVLNSNSDKKPFELKAELLNKGTEIAPFNNVKAIESLLKDKYRYTPVDFRFSFSKTFETNINYPSGYEPENKIENMNIQLIGNKAEFIYNVIYEKNRIKIKSKLKINKPYWEIQEYDELYRLMKLSEKKLKTTIKFKKVL